MIIKKYAEATVDESVFFGKIEVETDNKKEWESVIRLLQTMNEDSCVCHCNMKENAELVAKILDYDAENKVSPLAKFLRFLRWLNEEGEIEHFLDADDFCSYGERREDNVE